MGKLLDAAVRFFEEQQWHCERIEGQSALGMHAAGKNGQWACVALIDEGQEQYAFYSICPSPVPEERRSAVAEFLTRANYGLIIGNFEMDFDDGELRFKTSVDVEGSELTDDLIKPIVFLNVLAMDQYLPGILSVAFGDVTPTDAIDRVEADKAPNGDLH